MISIIIIVKNDRRLEKLLSKLVTIKYSDTIETIVIDASNSSLDDIKKTNPHVIWIQFNNKNNKKRTYAEQRNIGMRQAKGNIIVFIDADCIPTDVWLKNLLKPIKQENEAIISGAIKPTSNNYIHKEETYGTYRSECETMNMALTRNVIQAVGFFDETMEGCEDSDYCIRAQEKGYKIRYQKDAAVYHDWGGFTQNIKRSFNGGGDRISLYKKYPRLLFALSINNIYTWFYLSYVLFLPIAIYFPLYICVVFLPSLIKRRNPIKEFFNIAFAVGSLTKLFNYLFLNP